jgi:hypothetical protein
MPVDLDRFYNIVSNVLFLLLGVVTNMFATEAKGKKPDGAPE